MIKYKGYSELFRKYVIIFGTLFNDISIKRYNADDSELQEFKVPLAYGPAEKHMAIINNDPDKDKEVSKKVPRMGFEITGMSYDPARKLNTLNKIRSSNSSTYVYEGVPYNLEFQLNILSKTSEDAFKIIETILPYFTPDLVITTDLLDSYNMNKDIPVILNSVTPADEYESDFTSRRILKWSLDFTMKAYFVAPASNTSLIKIANVSTYDSLDSVKFMERILVWPGVDANGEPTTDVNNAISYANTEPTDNFAYIVQYLDSDDIE